MKALTPTATRTASAASPSGLLCCGCGDPDVSAISPGHEPKAFGNDVFTYERGVETRGWCVACRPDLRNRQNTAGVAHRADSPTASQRAGVTT